MSNINLILTFLNHQHYQSYFTPIAKALKSIEAAILFSEFVQRYQFHETREELIEITDKGGGWFYHTMEAIEERTAIGRRGMDAAVEILQKANLIEVTKHGLPCRRYFRLNLQGIEDFSKNLSSLYKVYKLGCTPCTNKSDQGVQTHSLYIKEPNKEPKEEPPPSSSLKKKKARSEGTVPFGQYVVFREGEYESLCADYGKLYVDYYIEAINNHVANNDPYKDYAAVVRQWHLRDKANGKMPNVQKVHEMKTAHSSPDQCAKNKHIAEIAEQKLNHLFSSHVFFQASASNALLVHLTKDIKKEIEYASYDTHKFKEVLLKELESCFPNARAILTGNTDNKVVNIISDLATKFKVAEVN